MPALVQLGLIGLLVVLAAIGWAVTDDRMGGMDAGPGTALGDLGWFVGVWVVMMAAMMFPSIAPMVIMYARIQEGKREREGSSPAGATAIFVVGYLVSWAAAGLAGYLIFEGVRSFGLDFLAWDEAGPYVAGGVIVAAAVYQLTPLKDVCLRHCRHPLMFLTNHWHAGRVGALRMGVEHGGFCVGCCWMLMAALFALGVMSIGWMAFIAALIAAEKLLPWQALANRGIAVLLAVLGIAVAFAPEDVPGLTLPDSPEAAQAMEAMGMEGEEGSMGMEGESMDEGSSGSMGTEGGSMDEESMGGGGAGMEEESMEGSGGAGMEEESTKGSSGQMDDAAMP
jgi:predicted metal-binding membrane protein